MGGVVVEGEKELGTHAVVEHRHPARDGVIGPVVHGGGVVIGHRLSVHGQPGVVVHPQQPALAVKLVHVVQPQVDITLAVVVKEVQFQGVDQPPLLLGEPDDGYAVRPLLPQQGLGGEAVFGQIPGQLLIS